jgi:photosystem II stability/assembly factor-like uncharacterized protein
MLETSDAGRTWTPLATGLKSGPPRHIFASPDGWFAAPGPGGLIRYDSSKATWVAVNQVIEKLSPAQPRKAATLKKISTGSSNASSKSAAPATLKSIVPFNARVNDMAFGRDSWYAASEAGLFVSRDHGLNWSAVPFTPVQAGSASSVAAGSPVRAIRLGNGNSYVWAATARQLEVSGDGGKTWIAHTLPFEPRGSVHILAADASTSVLSSDHGVYVSRDAGETWRQASLSELSIEDMTPIKSAIVVSTAKGALFLSRDAGKTWGRLSGPNADSSISALRSRDTANQLMAASATEGLFVLDMGSASSASVDPEAISPAPRQ